MQARVRAAMHLDWDAADVHRGVVGLAAIGATVALLAAFGRVGITAALAALFVLAADRPGPWRNRFIGAVILTGAGGVLALVGVWTGSEHVWVATLLTFVVTSLATIAAGFGQSAALRGLLLALWAILALSFAGAEESAGTFALAFVLGGTIAVVILGVSARWISRANGSGAPHSGADEEPAAALAVVVHSPLGVFALVRGASVGLATALGIELFPDHPIWPALTVLLIMRPKAGETFESGALRTLGTIGGILVAEVLIRGTDGADVAVALASLVSAFAMIALKDVNYAVFVLFLTALLLFMQEIVGDDPATAGLQRFLATVLGAGIAFLAIGIGRLLVRTQPAAAQTNP